MSSYPQIIPRPEEWRMGRDAPWLGLEAPTLEQISLSDVLQGLARHELLGDPPATPSVRDNDVEILDGIEARGELRHSAVLVTLFEEDGLARVLLTRRSTKLSNHRGEVSFPGGRLEPGEHSIAGALREANEEVNLDPAAIEVVGHLHPIVTLVSRSLIQPIVAVSRVRPFVAADPAEVERVFDVALSELVADGVFHEERWRRPERPSPRTQDGSFPLWFFEISGEMIWGATGRLLVDLLCMSLDVEMAPDR
jgi:8-oxo-dGTP pyrophosphatase MutT (NUDIX family)